jgi:hypothetical protein
MSERDNWIDMRTPPCWHDDRHCADSNEERRHRSQRGRVDQLHVEQKTSEYASNAQRDD